jgi:hypothetical protein
MKRSILVILAAALMGMPSYAAHWGGSGGGGGGGFGGGGHAGGGEGGGGGGEHASSGVSAAGHASGAPAARGAPFARSEVGRSIASRQGVERVPNHYYFHNEGGMRYWHYFGGPGGLHWYGFYFGPSFYWFPFYSGYWWWYDVNLARYAYWYNGYWWWNGPGGVPYIYADGDYIPYTQVQPTQQASADTSEATPAPPSAPPTAPPSAAAAAKAPAKEGSAEKSPDGKRMVQITGTEGGAFLFDESATPPIFMKHLGDNVEKVRYSGGSGGQPVKILVDYKDGTFGLFDEDGNPADKPAAAPAPGQ